jgi:hypothetical protein
MARIVQLQNGSVADGTYKAVLTGITETEPKEILCEGKPKMLPEGYSWVFTLKKGGTISYQTGRTLKPKTNLLKVVEGLMGRAVKADDVIDLDSFVDTIVNITVVGGKVAGITLPPED